MPAPRLRLAEVGWRVSVGRPRERTFLSARRMREAMAGIRGTLATAPSAKKAPVGDSELAALLAAPATTSPRLRDRALLPLGPRAHSGHSFRSGFMTTAAGKGRSLEAIMRQTGHNSERVARGDIQLSTVFINTPAKGLV